MSIGKLLVSILLVAIVVVAGGYWAQQSGMIPAGTIPGIAGATTQVAVPPPRVAPTQPVVATTVARQAVPLDFSVIGSVQASESVAVKSRLDGQIVKTHFKEGDEVKAGDLLFTLDSRAIEAQMHQAEANLARDQAQLVNYKRTVGRLGDLAQREFASRQSLDDARTNEAVTIASAAADQAAIENAKVQLSYTKILAPIDGRTGVITLTNGNTVKANDTVTIVTIAKIHPINVLFAVPQKYFDQVRQALAKGPVEAYAEIPNGGGRKIPGGISFFDNNIDPTTGTFQVKATFANDDGSLWPGMFVSVIVRLGVQSDALVVASAAVQSGQNGSYVFVVRPDLTAEMRPVTVAREADGRSIIASGLKDGEKVVVDGQLRLTNGTKVEVRAAAGERPPQPAPEKRS
jgi:multidrug efflux system membrane fusion protein